MSGGSRGRRFRLTCRRLWLHLAGAHEAHVFRVPPAEVTTLRTEGALLFAAVSGVLGLVFLVALRRIGIAWPIALSVAALVSTTILLLDRSILAAMLTRDGEARLRQMGLGTGVAERPWHRYGLIGGRVLMSMATSSAAVTLAAVALYADDIRNHLLHEHRRETAPLRARVEVSVDAEIAAARASFERAVAERNELSANLMRTRAPVDTSAADGERRALLARATDLDRELRATEAQYSEARRRLAAEETGTREKDSDSGDEGRGPRYRYAREVARQQAQRYAYLSRQRTEAYRQLTSLEARHTATLAAEQSRQTALGTELAPHLATADDRVAQARDSVERLADGRGRMIEARMEADPAYVPLRTGLIAQVEALGAVRGGSFEAWWLTFSIGVLLSVLELSALLLRLFFAAPSPVAVLQALDNAEAVDAAVTAFRSRAARRAGSPPTADWLRIARRPPAREPADTEPA